MTGLSAVGKRASADERGWLAAARRSARQTAGCCLAHKRASGYV